MKFYLAGWSTFTIIVKASNERVARDRAWTHLKLKGHELRPIDIETRLLALDSNVLYSDVEWKA